MGTAETIEKNNKHRDTDVEQGGVPMKKKRKRKREGGGWGGGGGGWGERGGGGGGRERGQRAMGGLGGELCDRKTSNSRD